MRILAALLFLSGLLQAADPFAGTWDLDIGKSRIDNPEVLKRVEMTLTERDGGLVWEDVRYFVNGQIRKRGPINFDQMEHPNPNTPGAKYTVRRLDATTIERVDKLNGKVIIVGLDALLTDGKTLLQFAYIFNSDGSLRSDETQVWHRR